MSATFLSRADLAARCLVIAQARMIAIRKGSDLDFSRFSDDLTRAPGSPEADLSPSDCRARLKALRAVLMDLPRHASGVCCAGLKNRRGARLPLIGQSLTPRCSFQRHCAAGGWPKCASSDHLTLVKTIQRGSQLPPASGREAKAVRRSHQAVREGRVSAIHVDFGPL